MASAKVVWSISERQIVAGPFATSQDASNALRRHLAKCGTTANDKVSGGVAQNRFANYELLTVTI